MADPRNIVLILGNGFDLDLGLRTSYKDFWESEYCPKNYPAPLIAHLNERWSDDLEAVKWYDLENELLEYYNDNYMKPEWDDVLTDEEMDFLRNYSSYEYACRHYDDKIDLINGLIEQGRIRIAHPLLQTLDIPYLEDYKLSIRDRDYIALQLIKKNLCKYLSELMKGEYNTNVSALSILRTVEEAHEKGHKVSIFTFNYTDLPNLDSELRDKALYYVHGSCSEGNIIIGTKDEEMPDTDYTFLQKAFDKNFNPPPIVSELRNATDVIIFGHSLGENDSQYLKDFFVQQASPSHQPKKITILTYDDFSEVDIKFSLQNLTGTRLSALYAQNDVTIIKTSTVLDNPLPLRDLINTYIGNVNRANALIPRKQ